MKTLYIILLILCSSSVVFLTSLVIRASKFEFINTASPIPGLSLGMILIILETVCIAFLIAALSNKGEASGIIALSIFGLIIAYYIYLLIQAIMWSV